MMKRCLFGVLTSMIVVGVMAPMLRAQVAGPVGADKRIIRFEAGILPNRSQPMLGYGAGFLLENPEVLSYQAKFTMWQSVPGTRSGSARFHTAARVAASAGKTVSYGWVDIAMYTGLAMDVLFLDGGRSESGGINPNFELRASIPYNDRIVFSLGVETLVSLFSSPVVTTEPFEIKAGIGWRL